MDSQDTQVLAAARRWRAEGQPLALITVARTWGSAPRPPGAWMVLRGDGVVQGSVSGGCIEADLIDRITQGGLLDPQGQPHPFVLEYGVTREEAQRYGLPCGGTMQLVVESAPDLASLDALAHQISAGVRVRRSVQIGQPGAVLTPAGNAVEAAFAWDGQTLHTVHGPRWRLLIIGAGQISSYLAPIAQALDYQVYVCDPRIEYTQEWQAPGVTLLTCMPDDAVLELRPDPHTAIVALTHDPKLDDMALLEALKSPAFYVGALGSTLNSQRRRERLLEYFDLSAEQVARLHGPVGLRLGSRTPPEIAVAIAAEMVGVRNGVAFGSAAGAACLPTA